MSANANVALDQLLWVFGIEFFVCLVAGGIAIAVDKAQERRKSRTRLAAQPKLTPKTLDAGCARLLAAIPAQRAGGDRRG